MRISFVNPPPADGKLFIREGRCMQSADSWATVWPPLTLAILAAIARDRAEVDLFDCNVEHDYDIERTVQRIREFQPDMVLLNIAFPSLRSDTACAAAIAAACPDAILVGFGGFFTILDEQAMQACPPLHLGLTGEPEDSFAELLELALAGQPLRDIPGLMWHQDGDIHKGPPRPLIEDLDRLPYPARDLFHNDRYLLPHNGQPFTLINLARGCPHHCSFCIATVYYGRGSRRHSVDYILEELERCQRDHGLRQFLFWEEIFTLDRDFGLGICEGIIQRGWDISWASTTRADRLDRELLSAMKRAGCMLLGLGIESAHQPILDGVNKGETVEDIQRGVLLCRQEGIPTMGHIVFGLPGETPETAEATIRYVLSLGLDYIQCYPAVPYPKTGLGERAAKEGWLRADGWDSYDFGGDSVMDIGTITPAQVDQARRDLYRRFYLRPGFAARQLPQLIRRPRQLLQASRFLNWMRPQHKR